MTADVQHAGGCQCGAVRFGIAGPLRAALYCHCGRCRRSHGGVAAYTACKRERLTLLDDRELRWYDSPDPTDPARRGFCGRCGSRLFWDRPERTTISIAAGAIDLPTGFLAAGHIYAADKGDYYEIADGLPCFDGNAPS